MTLRSFHFLHRRGFSRGYSYAALCTLMVVAPLAITRASATAAGAPQMSSATAAPALGMGVLPAAQLERLLPPSVYFQGQSAPLQLRNAAGFRDQSRGILWAGLVDNSGYSTGVRERYQFYLVSESAITIAGHKLPAGAYGAGFLSDGTLLIMDVGGHDLLKGKVENDASLKRPRPLQMIADGQTVRLYVGRQYVSIALGE